MFAEQSFAIDAPQWLTSAGLTAGSLAAILIVMMGVAWICGLQQGRLRERRAAGRRPGNPVRVTVMRVTEPATELGEGLVVDRSLSGVGLLVGHDVAVGTLLDIRPIDAVDNPPWARLEVMSASKEGDSWRLGCLFAKLPAWKTLRQLG